MTYNFLGHHASEAYSPFVQMPQHTIVETPSYLASAKGVLTDDERKEVVDTIAADPGCGALIVGGGGIRKMRHAIGNKGKSGGIRVIYFYHSANLPIFLLTVFAKGERENLSDGEVNTLATFVKTMVKKYGA